MLNIIEKQIKLPSSGKLVFFCILGAVFTIYNYVTEAYILMLLSSVVTTACAVTQAVSKVWIRRFNAILDDIEKDMDGAMNIVCGEINNIRNNPERTHL